MIEFLRLRLLMWLCLVLLPVSALAAGACSSHVGKVVLNEYANQLNYAEIRLLTSGYDVTNWKIRVYKNASTWSQGALPATGSNSCGNYQVTAFSSSETPIEADVVLLDGNDDVVDILRVRNSATVSTFYPRPSCNYVGQPTDLTNVAAGQKGIDRSPDGYGQWRQTPGTGSGSYTTRCAANQPNTAYPADLAATKVIKSGSPSTIELGGTTTYTLSVRNAGPNSATNVAIQETLPSGLILDSSSTPAPSAGTFDSNNKVWSIPSLAVGSTATLDLKVQGYAEGSWTNSITAASDNVKSVGGGANTVTATAPPVTVTSSLAGFGACESGATCSVTSRLYTKLAGTSYTFNVAALKADGTVAAGNASTVSVDLLANAAPVAKGTDNCPASQTSTIALGNKTFASGVVAVTVDAASNTTAYRDVAVRMTCSTANCLPNGATQWCASDAFAIRPASFTVAASGVTGFAAANAMEASKLAAGSSITLTASAVAGYTGSTLTLDSTKVLDHNASQQGSSLKRSSDGVLLAGGDLSWTNGTGTVAARYDEVGFFRLVTGWISDSSFTSVDQNASVPANSDCVVGSSSNIPDGSGKYGCNIAMTAETNYYGRFIPAYFETTPANGNQCTTSASGVTTSPGFTYAGQSFPVTVTAYASDIGTTHGSVTKNYQGDYSRAVTLTNAGSVTDISGNALGATAFSGGVAIASSVAYTPSSAVVPVELVMRASEPELADGVSSQNRTESKVNIRSGRLRLSNVYGSELLPLRMPVTIEYYSSNSLWLTNTLDGCTDPGLPTKTPSSFVSSVSNPAKLSSGASNTDISAPGAGNGGKVTLTIATDSYLKYKWNGSATAKDPEGQAVFGIFKGNKRLVYRRERY